MAMDSGFNFEACLVVLCCRGRAYRAWVVEMRAAMARRGMFGLKAARRDNVRLALVTMCCGLPIDDADEGHEWRNSNAEHVRAYSGMLTSAHGSDTDTLGDHGCGMATWTEEIESSRRSVGDIVNLADPQWRVMVLFVPVGESRW